MTLAMTSISLSHVFSRFVYIRARFRFALIVGNLTAQSTESHKEIGSGTQIPEERRSCKLSFLFPPRHQNAPGSLLTGYEKIGVGWCWSLLDYTVEPYFDAVPQYHSWIWVAVVHDNSRTVYKFNMFVQLHLLHAPKIQSPTTWFKITGYSPDHPFAFERTWILTLAWSITYSYFNNVIEKKKKKKPSSQEPKVISDFFALNATNI